MAKLSILSVKVGTILRTGALPNSSPILGVLKTMEEFNTLRMQIDGLKDETGFLAERLTGETRTGITEQKQAIRGRVAVLDYANTAWLKHVIRIEEILKRGYDPSMPPETWYIGLLEQPHWWEKQWVDESEQVRRVFRQPVPYAVEQKYRVARKTKLFDRIVVASPFQEDFRISGRPLNDPGIWGFIPKDPEVGLVARTNPRVIGNCIGFHIAMWDFAKDRARAGL